MAQADYIPAGRTSLAKKGSASLQVQTEYAYRPAPRITTTILQNGQVLHKVERTLPKAIENFDEKSSTELIIRKQHAEVVAIIEAGPTGFNISGKIPIPKAAPKSPVQKDLLAENLKDIPGVSRVYKLDPRGRFASAAVSTEFEHRFAEVFQSLGELLSVFAQTSGEGSKQEIGVFEVERRRLYLGCSGDGYYIAYIEYPGRDFDYEAAIRWVLNGGHPAAFC